MFESKDPYAEIKVIDFGLSKKYLDPDVIIKDRVGTVYTMAPEVIGRIPYSFKADMFSLGVIDYMLLSERYPFSGKSNAEIARKITACKVSFGNKVWENISKDAKDLVKKLLSKDPSDRPTAKEAASHAWFKLPALSDVKPDPELLNGVEESLVRFSDSGEFKKLVLNVLAHRTTTDDIKKLRAVFDSYDTENNGFITFEEFRENLSHYNFSEEELDKIFNSVVSDAL